MEATFITYDKHLLIQFENLLVDGDVVIKNKNNEIIKKQHIQNKNFTMIELKEVSSQLFIEIIDNTNKKRITKQTI